MGVLSEQVVEVARALASRAAVAEQDGIISGMNPSAYNASDPIQLWVIQIVIIMGIVQLLSMILRYLRQPRVISEVIGGVILGPSIMGRIPKFSNTIFPTNGMPILTLTATVGLIFFLFLMGMEIDVRVVKRNARASGLISLAGLAIPLGLGAALGVAVYRKFADPTVNFGYFILFIAVAIGITAFPVLCRILTELQLLDTTVGNITLAAGVGNDVVGWILLALTVALVNAGTGIVALYVLLCSVGFALFLLFPVRWGYLWLARRTGSMERGVPDTTMMSTTFIIVLGSAFFTDVIGVHPIFGGFLAGLIIPHENGYAIALTEKIEDLVSILLLPIYFVLTGLKTNLGLLDNGITWGYVFLICTVAFFSKFLACGATAYACGFNWREAGAVGSLMSCKGLVELIALNVGLTAGILDTRTFSMFVLHAIILTVMTTPLTLFFYPLKHRGLEGKGAPKVDTEGTRRSEDENKTRFAIVLDKLEQLPAAMTFAQLLQAPGSRSAASTSASLKELEATGNLPEVPPTPNVPRVSIDALRLIELQNRTSGVLKSQEADVLLHNDPIVAVFRTFGHLNRLAVNADLSVVEQEAFPEAIADYASDAGSQMVVIPWARGAVSVEGWAGGKTGAAHNPFDGIFHKTTTQDQTSSVVYSEFIRKVFLRAPTDVALFVDRGLTPGVTVGSSEQRLFLPFVGGPDDRLALSFLVQLLTRNATIKATIVWVRKTDGAPSYAPTAGAIQTMAAADTVYGQQTTETRMVSDTADNILWDRLSASAPVVAGQATFQKKDAPQPLHAICELVETECAIAQNQGRPLIVFAGRSRRMAVESHKGELESIVSGKGTAIVSALSKTVGDVSAALVASGTSASLLVMQAAV
ncbi:hypothetical protein HMN09_01149600 [Mycena chlorophos]|uniref:Cation/H+ exchanger transmembrane domain-containing protein n=1 Tax=Mycena chlorophos TaxID=658473 RepID=A0A8H6VUA6_MYCCL|nr:hypothetical protein HMN09_01149600 [Mycena chlorophos]